MNARWAIALLALLACDPSASTTDVEAALAGPHAQAWESCVTSGDCTDGLRCFATMCRPPEVSTLGDYYWVAASRALDEGRLNAAIEHYGKAGSQYEAETLDVPLALRCERGHALVLGRDRADRAEEGARVLHACLLAAPPASPLRVQALRDLAVLADQGLDPLLLARAELAPKYLVKVSRRPSEGVEVVVTSDAKTSARSHRTVLEALRSATLESELMACWQAQWEEAEGAALTTEVPLVHRFVQGTYEEDDRWRVQVDGPPPAAASPNGCIWGVVEKLTSTLRSTGGGPWSGTVTISIK